MNENVINLFFKLICDHQLSVPTSGDVIFPLSVYYDCNFCVAYKVYKCTRKQQILTNACGCPFYPSVSFT